jgi:uncharacterized protein YaeQ
VVARHPSETAEHATLRVLAWCLFPAEGLAFGPGVSDGDAADLWARDPAGEVTAWIECGAATAERVKKVLQHHPAAELHVLLAAPRRRDELLAEMAAWPRVPRGIDRLAIWELDPAFVAALAARDARRQRWTVTVVEGHVYVDADGDPIDGPIARVDVG